MNQRNYQKECDALICKMKEEGCESRPTLLLHICCAPCSSYTLEYLNEFFDITVFFYNPNITDKEEYEKRKQEEIRFLSEYPFLYKPDFIEGDFEPEVFLNMAKGQEEETEGGSRCFGCYELRLLKTAKLAKEKNFDYFCTSLSISPHKNANKLMEIGERLGKEFGVAYLPSDFKKKNGYKRSIELSKEYHLYRQNYCGCQFSKAMTSKAEDI